MKTHNLWIYHCECCGKVVEQEPETAPPTCCHGDMTRAAARTVLDQPVGGCGCEEREEAPVFTVGKPR